MNTSNKIELTVSISHTKNVLKSGTPIYNPEVPNTAT